MAQISPESQGRSNRLHFLHRILAALVALGCGIEAEAAVTAGGIAIVGYTDNLSEDTFSIVALEAISPGTTIYFTDNGWNTTDAQFRGATSLDGNGNETLVKLSFTSSVAAGTIMKCGVNGVSFTWDTSSTITGTSDFYSHLALAQSGAGDQIYAFEADNDPPLFNPSNPIFLLDLGDQSNGGGFEDATSSNTGNVPTGLGPGSPAFTAVELPDPAGGDDAGDFHNGSFALNMTAPDVFNLNLTGGTKAQWLAVIADTGNWYQYDGTGMFDPSAEDSLFTFNVLGVPEPSRAILLMSGIALSILRRRR